MASLLTLTGACRDTEAPQTWCGDGYIQRSSFETCDDGNNIDGDGCQSDCQLPICGDGVVDPGEECDSNFETRLCNADCTLARCGDAVVNLAADEKCDDGNNVDGDGCQGNCLLPRCGDGIVDRDEQCDGHVETATCNWDCSAAVCGDGIINVKAGESCDDGNTIGGDACPADCLLPECGDGVLDVAFGEQCDDGNNDDGDSCPANCSLATKRVFTSRNQSCVLDGDLYCWGHNESGQLGTGTAESIGDDELPYTVAGMPVQVDASAAPLDVALGGLHTCVVLDNATAKCWGDNFWGQLGQGHSNHLGAGHIPVDIPAIVLSDDPNVRVRDIAAGWEHTCISYDAGGQTGLVKCFGSNFQAQLGYGHSRLIGDEPGELASVESLRLGAPVVQLSAGLFHTCALLQGGSVRCWGENGFGQLGIASTRTIGDDEHPDDVDVADIGGPVRRLFAGPWHNCAQLESGEVRCWGSNTVGELGLGHNDENIGDDETPASVAALDLPGELLDIAVGNVHTCALMANGTVACWGDNEGGQLGQWEHTTIGAAGDLAGDYPHVLVLGGALVAAFDAGTAHNCALLRDDSVACWGWNLYGQLGLGHHRSLGEETGDLTSPVPYLPGGP